YRDGRRWACGLRAYVALLNLIGSAAIECHPNDTSKPDVVVCHKGSIDLSEWMLEHGWARLHPGVTDKRYVAAVQTAKAGKVGIWVEEPPSQ
ncbi:MAG: thermonuclease family protein, partial [Gammaproteobacteria bacterium]